MSFNSFYYNKYLNQIDQVKKNHEISDKKFVVEDVSSMNFVSERIKTVSCGLEKINYITSEKKKGVGFYLYVDKLGGVHKKFESVQLSFLYTKSFSTTPNKQISEFLNSLSRLSILTKGKNSSILLLRQTKQGFILFSAGFIGFIHKSQVRKNFLKLKNKFSLCASIRSRFIFSLLNLSKISIENFLFFNIEESRIETNFNFVSTKTPPKFKIKPYQSKRFRFSFGPKNFRFFKNKTFKNKKNFVKKKYFL